MKNSLLYLTLVIIIVFTRYTISQEISPLEYFPYHVGDIRQYIEIPSGQFYSGQITRIDTINVNTHLIYYANNEIPSYKVITDSAIIFVDSSNWIPYWKLGYPLSSIWVRDTTTSWWVHFKSQFISEVFNEDREMREYHIYEYIPPGDTNGLPGSVDYLVKGIGFYRNTWEGGEIILTGCIINGIQFGTIINVEDGNTLNSPGEFLLNNYPNPFNPQTKIKFYVPERTFVKLRVFDLLGDELEILVNEEKDSGYHEIVFDGSELPSGIYFYNLQTQDFIQTRKMVLLK